MYLRSGKTKGRCPDCHEFWATSQTGNRCSYCFKGTNNLIPWRDASFQHELCQWVQHELDKTEPGLRKVVEGLYRFGSKVGSKELFESANDFCVRSDVKLSSEFAKELCSTINFEMSSQKPNVHQILPHVIDWWNMRTWCTSAIKCYYTRFDDPLDDVITKVPPPPPQCPQV